MREPNHDRSCLECMSELSVRKSLNAAPRAQAPCRGILRRRAADSIRFAPPACATPDSTGRDRARIHVRAPQHAHTPDPSTLRHRKATRRAVAHRILRQLSCCPNRGALLRPTIQPLSAAEQTRRTSLRLKSRRMPLRPKCRTEDRADEPEHRPSKDSLPARPARIFAVPR